MKRVFIIHGWDGNPEEAWLPWLKKELEGRGYKVFVPAMPNPTAPTIADWVNTLQNAVEKPDSNTYFVGFSIGCQAILRYLETLENIMVGSIVLVAPWMTLSQEVWNEGEKTRATGKPWIETPIDFDKVGGIAKNFTCIFSDNDPFVPYKENRKVFTEKLNAQILTETGKGHFRGSDGVIELPVVLSAFDD